MDSALNTLLHDGCNGISQLQPHLVTPPRPTGLPLSLPPTLERPYPFELIHKTALRHLRQVFIL